MDGVELRSYGVVCLSAALVAGGSLFLADLDKSSLGEEAWEARGTGVHPLLGFASDRSGSPPARARRAQGEFVGLGGIMRDLGA